MEKTQAIQKAKRLAKRLKTDVYVIQDEPGLGCAVLTQAQYDDYPSGWIHQGDIVAGYDEYGRSA